MLYIVKPFFAHKLCAHRKLDGETNNERKNEWKEERKLIETIKKTEWIRWDYEYCIETMATNVRAWALQEHTK